MKKSRTLAAFLAVTVLAAAVDAPAILAAGPATTGAQFLSTPTADAVAQALGGPKGSVDMVSAAVLKYKPTRLTPALTSALLTVPELVRARYRALGLLVLLRLARVIVNHHLRGDKAGGPMPAGFQREAGEAVGPLDPANLVDTGFQMGEMGAAFSIGKSTEALLSRRFAATTLSRAMALKLWAYAPVFVAWSISNQVYVMMQQGQWPQHITMATVVDLGKRVGGELAGILVFTLALKALAPAALWIASQSVRGISGLLGLDAAETATAIASFASKVIRIASIAGWVLLALQLSSPYLEKGWNSLHRSDIRSTTGASIQYLDTLDDTIEKGASGGAATPEQGMSDQDVMRWMHSYASLPANGDTLVKSKKDLFYAMAVANNTEVENRVAKIKNFYLDELTALAKSPPDTTAAKKADAQAQALKVEIPKLFQSTSAGIFSLLGGTGMGETDAIDRELALVQGTHREQDNRIVLGPRVAQYESVAEGVARRFYGSARGASFMGDPQTRQRNLDDYVSNMRGDVETQAAAMVDYLQARKEQIQKLASGLPTLDDVKAEKALLDMGVAAVHDLQNGSGATAGSAAAVPPPPGFEGLENPR